MRNYKHIVFTRFNVRITKDMNIPSRGLNDDWLTRRIEFFEQFCLPSLHGQSNQNFLWFVLLDTQSPDWLKQKMREYSEWENFKPIYLNGSHSEADGCTEELKIEIRKEIPDSCKYLITSRVDNDDALATGYIQLVQNQFKEQQSAIAFTSPFGYQYIGRRLYVDFSRDNHFVSMIEPYHPGSFKTVIARAHNYLYTVCELQYIWTIPMWVEHVHDHNLANQDNFGFPVSSADFCRRFVTDKIALDDEPGRGLPGQQIKYIVYGVPRYVVRKGINRLRYHGPMSVRNFIESFY
ncbi:MAG: hypothetical protein JXX14_07640 [Deltaproteobacteria bacterium]|nr:hypothetical protein [Deltaproteobacteria bacterium]